MTTLQAVELGVLGPLQVRQGGAPVAVPGAKPRAILTMLGLHGGSIVAADTLVELLWGEDPPRTAAKALQTHISSLRRALGDGFILTAGAGWTLAESDVDATRYKSAARLGRDAATAGDTSQAVARFEEALALWRGVPELPDSRRGTSEKTRWIEGHAALVEDRLDALLATGRAAEVVGDLEAAVADAPLRERRWGQLILALYRAGRQGEALSAYQRARSLLADELGVDPGPELRRLEAAIVAQDASLDVPVAQNLSATTRAVTFLLTDIEGSTAAWEADANAMGVALARHDELVEQVVTSRGGRLIKTRGEGDATFSVFERPSAAAAAAIELQDAIAHEPWALRDPMRVRVALHTGEAELRDGDYFGRAVNRAARLRSLAEGGQILCSGATAELVIDSLSDDVVLNDLGMRQLKNLARPEHVFELRMDTDEPRQEASPDEPVERPSLPAVLAGPGPFVGRGRELARLFSAWQSTVAGGANAVLIAGEPGVGKTRLAGEWSRQAYDQGALVIYGRCDEDLGAPYQPFAEALRSLVPCLGAKSLRGLRGVESLLALVPGLTDVLPDLAAPTRADPDTERFALFDAVVALLALAAAGAPVVLILDDLHWAAKPTLLLLRHLLRFGENARVQIVGTYRSTDLDRSHPLAAMLADLHRDGTASRIALSGLDQDDVTAYVAEVGYDDEELARALASVTGGNPFFLIEALRHVEESGGHWDPSTLPQGVREAVTRRLSRLTPETNKALGAAAVVGSRFSLELVERVVGDDLVDAFDEACKAGIVIEEPGGNYRFNHALVRQSLLAELASVRRMRLHQSIATTLEAQPGADDELLAELAYHYFECAWAGNAGKAVDYCRRAADQAMARLGYEAAADLYDRALHALEEIDEELPDREDQATELMVARCEALLAAGDVTTAAGAVAQLQRATSDSARLAAWTTCFDGELSMLTNPERLDEIEAALGAAAAKLAELADAAGEAKAHTVRASCLARLGRVGDCEIALDDALTAARRAGEHRRVNAVLAGAPLAALWGPNPVPRAGGRCLDVVRLLRITTDSPAVEATSTRCQAVLEAFRGRAEAARRMIDSARRTVTELGLRHALLEVEQFAGIVELVVDDPAAAEPHLRQAYNGFRRMGLDADTAETAALLGRACLALDREAEADELCTESERLAGHALKPAIAWRTLRAYLLSRRGEHDEARRLAEAAVSVAERTDVLVDHGDACLCLATVLATAGDVTGARAAAERAVVLWEHKGAAALAERARGVLGESAAPAPAPPEPPSVEPDNAAVQVGERVMTAIHRRDWDEFERLFAPEVSIESRRKVVGLTVSSDAARGLLRRELEMGTIRVSHVMVAARGERLALSRLITRFGAGPGAPQDELLQLYAIDEEGRVASQVWFDVDDLDAALAELDAMHARFEAEQPRRDPGQLDNACLRVGQRVIAAIHSEAWDAFEELYAPDGLVESRRKIVGFRPIPAADWAHRTRRAVETGAIRFNQVVIAVKGERIALARLVVGTADVTPDAPQDEFLSVLGIDEQGRVTRQVWFDVDDMDAALAELDAFHARFEREAHRQPGRLETAATAVCQRFASYLVAGDWGGVAESLADNIAQDDRRRLVGGGLLDGRDAVLAEIAVVAPGIKSMTTDVIATRGEHLVLNRVQSSVRDERSDAFGIDVLDVIEIDADERVAARVVFDLDDFDAAIAELDARYLAGEAAAHAHTWSAITKGYNAISRHELPSTTPHWTNIDHRQGRAFAPGEMIPYIHATWEVTPQSRIYIEAVHRLGNRGAVVTNAMSGSSREGFDADWREVFLLMFEGDSIDRCELFDEADLDVALARFEEFDRPARRLENAATQTAERLRRCFAARDWDGLADVLAEDILADDRRRVVGIGIRHGRQANVTDIRIGAEVGSEDITSTVIATRGERISLDRARFTASDQQLDALSSELLRLVEVDTDNRMTCCLMFDVDDMEAAFAELDARYLAGEAAAHAKAWSIVAESFAALRRQEIPAISADSVFVDHRRASAGTTDLTTYIRAGWDQHIKPYIEVVHRLSDFATVCSYAAQGISDQGFDAEWQGVEFSTFEGDLINRCEFFDEADLPKAIEKFDQLSRPARRLENAASQAVDRYLAHFAARDWDALAELLTDDISTDDRRRVVGAGARHGRDAQIADMRAVADLWTTSATSTCVAIRGRRLALSHIRLSGQGQGSEAFLSEVLAIVEIDAENKMTAHIAFDPDDFDAAIAELDARYLAGEGSPHARVWSVITGSYAAINRREQPAITPDWITVDHRRETAMGPGDISAHIASNPDYDNKPYVETAHRLSNEGAVITYAAHETSREGFNAEWRGLAVCTVKGNTVNRCEVFDEVDLDAALAQFEQLCRPTLSNAASQAYERICECLEARDWNAVAELTVESVSVDDRAEVGFAYKLLSVIATRGDRLALTRVRASGRDPETIANDALNIVEIGSDGRIAADVIFDLEDIDAAFAELDARYLAGEAVDHGPTWSVIARLYAGFNRHELPATAPDWSYIDHRPLISVQAEDMSASIRAIWELTPDISIYMEAVHLLGDIGAVVTHIARGVSSENSDVEWRLIAVFTVDGDLISRCEMFDEADLDAALARFDELQPRAPQLENAASAVVERFWSCFAKRNWAAMADTMADEVCTHDRRRVVNADVLHGRAAHVANMRAVADVGFDGLTSTVTATRGDGLALVHIRSSVRDSLPAEVTAEMLSVIEIDADHRIVGAVMFDADQIDAAFEELDARYVAGEAAAYAHTWSLMAGTHAALNRRELPATTADFVNIDHRRGVAFAPGDLVPYAHDTFNDVPDASFHIVAAHRLNNLGAVITQAIHGTSREGLDAEWQNVGLFTFEGELANRCEIFDETDLDVALARFDELRPHVRRLENTASQAFQRLRAHYVACNWAAVAEVLADDISTDDRRTVVNAGTRQGRDAEIANMKAVREIAATNTTSWPPATVIATRGNRLALCRAELLGPDQAFNIEMLLVTEVDTDGRIAAHTVVDPDDIDAAFEELDARYLAGEAADCAQTWSLIAAVAARFNRRELPATTPDPVYIDHRPLVSSEGAELAASIRAVWDITSHASVYIEAVHQLSERGAVYTEVLNMTSHEGLDAEVRMIMMFTVEGDLISRVEVFDEADLDVAHARFEELQPHTRQLENAASRAYKRFWASAAVRAWDAMAETLADGSFADDRRHVVNAGLWQGREAVVTNMRALADVQNITWTVVVTRGERLALARLANRDPRDKEFGVETLTVVEIDDASQIAAHLAFDADDIDAAIAELDARYLAGEAAAHTHTWSVIARECAAFNRHGVAATTPDPVYIDHRPLVSIAGGDLAATQRAVQDLTPNARTVIKAVHRLNSLGAVVTQAVKGTSPEGFEAEWQMVSILTVEGDLISRYEVFDEADLDGALARFDELPSPPRRLENAASRAEDRFFAYYRARDWAALAKILTNSTIIDNRTPVTSSGFWAGRHEVMANMQALADAVVDSTSEVVAIRGDRLSLGRHRFPNGDARYGEFVVEQLIIAEVDTDNRIAAHIVIDPDDLDAAFEELDARYLAGEAAAHARTWSLVADACAAMNRHEHPATTTDCVNIDHRRGLAFAPGDMTSYLDAVVDSTPDFSLYIEAVHRLTDRGAVAAYRARGTSPEGFDAEWRVLSLVTFEGNLMNRMELFDEADLDVALARFEELQPHKRRLENAATRAHARLQACATAGDWKAATEIFADDVAVDDRRRVVNSGIQYGRDAVIADMRGGIDLGLTNISLTVIATRGDCLELCRMCISGQDRPDAFRLEFFSVVEINADNRIVARVAFDLEDLDAAFAELDARYLAGEAAPYARTWRLVTRAYAALNKRQLPATTADWINIDHRRLAPIATGDLGAYLRATWDLSPHSSIRIEAVHRLSEIGAVVTQVVEGTSQLGFDAEWRTIDLATYEGDEINRSELFDEEDLDSALTRFDELHPRAPQLETPASQVAKRFSTIFAARDWESMATIFAADITVDDRRRGINAGIRHGRAATIEDLRATVGAGFVNATVTVIATRGGRLALTRFHLSARERAPEAFHVEVLHVFEINAESQITAVVVFDLHSIDSAFEELDSRYIAGEAAAHAHIWALTTQAYAAFNRRQISALTPDWVNIDHRRGLSFAPGDMIPYLQAAWNVMPDNKGHIEAVHRISNLGAVITAVGHGTSELGFDAEWRYVHLLTFEADMISRGEFFDETDVDAALARFDELHRQAPRLENAATQMWARLADAFNRRDLEDFLALSAADLRYEDRRKGLRDEFDGSSAQRKAVLAMFEVSASSVHMTAEPVAIRGSRLSLNHVCYRDTAYDDPPITVEMMQVVEVSEDGLLHHSVSFDPDAVDGAFEELDARYLAGEAAPYARTWSVLARTCAAFNQGELPATTPDSVYVDHRPGLTVDAVDLPSYLRAMWDVTPDIRVQIEAVHRLSELGAVVTHVVNSTSPEGFNAEWRGILICTLEADMVNRQVFDESDLDAALARFEELGRPAD